MRITIDRRSLPALAMLLARHAQAQLPYFTGVISDARMSQGRRTIIDGRLSLSSDSGAVKEAVIRLTQT
jgi:hypothetical protein